MRIIKTVLCVLAVLGSCAFVACDDNGEGSDYYVKFTLDGEKYNFDGGYFDVSRVPFINVSGTGSWGLATPDGTTIGGEPDNYVAIEFNTTVSGVYNESNSEVNIIIEEQNYDSISHELVVDTYGNVGGTVSGSFTGDFTDGLDLYDVSGTFRMKRIADNTFAP